MIEGNFRVRPDADPSACIFPQIRTLPAGEVLFREGDSKTSIYRVESGAICTYALAGASKHAFLEFIYAGDWFGLGYLDRHTIRARAMVETRVGLLAMAHVVAALGGVDWVDLDTAFLLADDPFQGGWMLDGPRIRLIGDPGLGVSVRPSSGLGPSP